LSFGRSKAQEKTAPFVRRNSRLKKGKKKGAGGKERENKLEKKKGNPCPLAVENKITFKGNIKT